MEHNTCRENLSAYLDGELQAREKAQLEAHLADCPDCRAVLGQLGAVSGIIKKHIMEPVPPALKGAALGGREKASYPWFKPVLALSTAAAGLLVVLNLSKNPERPAVPQLPKLNAPEQLRQSMNAAAALLKGEAGRAMPSDESAAPARDSGDAGMPAASSPAGLFPGSGKRRGARSSVAAVRGAYGQAKFAAPRAFGSAGGGAAGAEAEAEGKPGSPKMPAADKPQAAEFRGPVCVYVSSLRSRREASESMDETERDDFFWYLGKALLFLEKTGTPSPSAEPGNLVFVKNDGSRRTVTEKDCSLGFVFFDGVQDPLPVNEFIFITDEYNKYFGASFEPIGDDIPD